MAGELTISHRIKLQAPEAPEPPSIRIEPRALRQRRTSCCWASVRHSSPPKSVAMRAPTILNLRTETPVASSFTNGNSLGLLREPVILPFPYRLPSVKKPRFLRCGSIQSEVRPLQLEVRDLKCVLSPSAAALETPTCSGRTSRARAGHGGRSIWPLCLRGAGPGDLEIFQEMTGGPHGRLSPSPKAR